MELDIAGWVARMQAAGFPQEQVQQYLMDALVAHDEIIRDLTDALKEEWRCEEHEVLLRARERYYNKYEKA